jgi:hypothetical protein
MAKIVVSPERFTLVFFDADRIAELASDVADRVGLGEDTEVRIDVDERIPLGRTKIVSLDPVTLSIEGGAFEDAKKPRHMSERSVLDVLGRLFLRVKDRLDPSFADAPADDQLSLPESVAWTVYSEGRCERLGLPTQKPRWLYHFRNRHGFTDAADAAFNRLWQSEVLAWSDIQAVCEETARARADFSR